DLLGARREGDLTGGDLVALADDTGDLGADLLHRDVERLEDTGGKSLLLAKEAEQDVLGADVVVLQGPGLVLRENHDLPGPFGESLEQLPRRSFRSISGAASLPDRRDCLIVADSSRLPGSPGAHGTLLDR